MRIVPSSPCKEVGTLLYILPDLSGLSFFNEYFTSWLKSNRVSLNSDTCNSYTFLIALRKKRRTVSNIQTLTLVGFNESGFW